MAMEGVEQPPELNAGQEEEEARVENALINEEYKAWKKNSPVLYDLLYARALEWPSLTCQWFPDVKDVPDSDVREHRVLFGTNTSGAAEAKEYLQIARLQIPVLKYASSSDELNESGEIGGHGVAKHPFSFEIVQRLNHPGEVNKARYMPQNPNLLVSMGTKGSVLFFDRTKHDLQPKTDAVNPQLRLVGHTAEGFGLAFNPNVEGQLATGSSDGTVRLWDVSAYSSSSSELGATQVLNHHTAGVNDVDFHPKHRYLLASVSDDRSMRMVDTRKPEARTKLNVQPKAHADAVNCVAWHGKWEYIMATGSADKTAALWDIRFLKQKLHSIAAHTDSVIKLEWHPNEPSILATGSYDRRINIYDLSRVGEEQTEEEAEDGPPELLFMHGGFTNRICDFGWNPNDPWTMLGTAEDNQMQIFRPAASLVNSQPSSKVVAMSEIEE